MKDRKVVIPLCILVSVLLISGVLVCVLFMRNKTDYELYLSEEESVGNYTHVDEDEMCEQILGVGIEEVVSKVDFGVVISSIEYVDFGYNESSYVTFKINGDTLVNVYEDLSYKQVE